MSMLAKNITSLIFQLFLGLCVAKAQEQVDSKLVLGHLRNATEEYNKIVGALNQQGVQVFDSELKFKMSKEDRSHFKGLNKLLAVDIVVNKIVFSQGNDVVLVVPIKEFLEDRLVINERREYLNSELSFSKVKESVDSALGASTHKRVIASSSFRDLASVSVALYAKVVRAKFQSHKSRATR